MDDGSRLERRNLLATAIWDSNLDASAEGKLGAYFRWIGREFHGSMHELVFFVDIIRSNMALERSALSQAVRDLRAGWEDKGKETPVVDDRFHHPAASSVTDELKDNLKQENSSVDDRMVDAVRVVFALDLATDQITAGGGQVQSFWDSSQSLNDVIEGKFPKYRLRQDTQMTQKAIPIDQRNFAAKYLENHAGVKIEWTTHLPDHLLLEDKTLYVFELACMLEIAYNTRPSMGNEDSDTVEGPTEDVAPGQSPVEGSESRRKHIQDQDDLEECVRINGSDIGGVVPGDHSHGSRRGNNTNVAPTKGRYDADFLAETLMTFSLLFPSRDSTWLRARIKPRRRWPRYWVMSPERDARLAAAETSGRPLETHRQYLEEVRDTQKLFELYPHWARRWQVIHQEAEAPTPVSRLDKWAQRRKDERHTFKVAYLALLLAIGFGVVATVVGVLQLWVSYCQWQVQDGGYGCGARKGSSQRG